MKKVLIYRKESELVPTGGPKGYLYNLNCGLKQIDERDVFIEYLPSDSKLSNSKKKNKLKSFLPKFVLRIIRSIRHGIFVYNIVNKESTAPVDINEYDMIHFHDTCSMYPLRKQLEKYDGIVVLTSHSPQPLHQEFTDNASKLEKRLLKKTFAKLHFMDEYAFNRADYIIFPTNYSDEPYMNRWKIYRDLKKKTESKYRFLLTGTIPANPKISRQDVRTKYGIPMDAFVICYVGRHSSIKGYDDLIKYCIKFCKDNVYVLVAGSPGTIKPPHNSHWIEVGWTNDPYSIINASDVFVLPNKETYFDLVLLEVLSIGTIALISNTGGNKYFISEKTKGIFIFDNEDDFDIKMSTIMNQGVSEKETLRLDNRNLYYLKFTVESFSLGYLNIIKSLFIQKNNSNGAK